MATEYGSRLKKAREYAKLTQIEASKRTGIAQSTISTAERLGNGSSDTPVYAKAYGVSAHWLATGDGAMIKIESVTSPQGSQKNIYGNVDAARAFAGEVPVISWVQAGSWHEAADSFQPGEADRFLPVVRGHSSSTYALKVRGDSMTAPYGKSYPAGCYVIVDPEKRSPVNGDRIIALTPGSKEATFKVYKDEDGRRWLAPLNSTHQIILEPFEVLGTVIGKWEDE
jgi:SOS-response transcriptional repressor LexA